MAICMVGRLLILTALAVFVAYLNGGIGVSWVLDEPDDWPNPNLRKLATDVVDDSSSEASGGNDDSHTQAQSRLEQVVHRVHDHYKDKLQHKAKEIADSFKAKVTTNTTGFRIPNWEARCDVNRTHFEPSCLPEEVYKRKNVDDFMFAVSCGVDAASIRTANLLEKKDVHAKVFELVYDNLIATVWHGIVGLATMGIFLKRKKPTADYTSVPPESPEPADIYSKLKAFGNDNMFFCLTIFGAASAITSGAFTFLKFWGESVEYISGVWNLSNDVADYHCKAVLLSEMLYYKDILGYITLSAFNIVDLITIISMTCLWCLTSCNLVVESCVCGPCQLFFRCLINKLVYCFTCKWCGAFCAWVKYLICRACCDCCNITCVLCCKWCMHICKCFYWAICQCGCCKVCLQCCCACKNCFIFCCWSCGSVCSHLSCLCICNFLCRDCCVICSYLTAAFAIIWFIPMMLYLFFGLTLFFLAVALTIGVASAITLVAFWLVTQLVAALMMIKERCVGQENTSQFMGLFEYYGEFFSQIRDELFVGFSDLNDMFDFSKKVSAAEKTHNAIPHVMADAATVAKESTKDQKMFGICIPVVVVLLLVWGSQISHFCVDLKFTLENSADMSWAGCTDDDGAPTPCKSSKAYTLEEVSKGDLKNIAGILVPPSWPLLQGCSCFDCKSRSLIKGNISCGAFNVPGTSDELLSCPVEASDKKDDSSKEPLTSKKASKKGTNPEETSSTRDRRLLTVYNIESIKQNKSLMTKPNGKGDGGYVVEGRHKYLGEGIKIYPKLLNTYAMRTERPLHAGCYGASLPRLSFLASSYRMDGFCDCSSEEFIPVAYDKAYQVSFVEFPPYVSKYLPSFLTSDIAISNFTQMDGDYFFTAYQSEGPQWKDIWLQNKEREFEEWYGRYGADPHFGWRQGVINRAFAAYRQLFNHASEMFQDLFVGTVYSYAYIVLLHFDTFRDWALKEFYTAQRFQKVFTQWLKTAEEEDFKEAQEIVLLGRSMNSLVTGMATVIGLAS